MTFVLAGVALMACGSQTEVASDNSQLAIVDEIELRLVESSPIQMEVWASGIFADPCSGTGDITEQRDGNTISLTILEEPSNREGCENDEFTEFIQIIPLDVDGLHVGTYTVNVNGVSGTFELSAGSDTVVQVDLAELFANPELYDGKRRWRLTTLSLRSLTR